MAAPLVAQAIREELSRSMGGIPGMKFVAGFDEAYATPAALTEPDDMEIVTSPCHAYEPIKVSADPEKTLFCLVCGSQFAL